MTPSANLNPMAALQAPPSGKRQPGPAADDSPFSRVLSNEIAQKESGESRRNEAQRSDARRSDATSEARRSDARSEARQAAESRSESAPTDPTAAQHAAASEAAASDPQKATAADSNAQQPVAQPDAASLAALPDAILAMAAAPALLMPPPASSVPASDAPLLAPATGLPATLSGAAASQANPLAAAPTDPLRDAAADSQAAQQPLKADFQAAMTASSAQATAAAAALPGQIAAALSPDALSPDEGRPDGIGNPLMATTSQHAQLNAITAQASAASNALAPSVGSAAWNQALGEKIVWMTAGALQTASLTLNPPNLGPLQVVLNVTNDQATASFFAAQPEVRQALEAALPKLREMMNEAGIQLGQATVSAEQQQQQQQNEANREARRIGPAYPGAGNADESTIQSLPLPSRRAGRGLVDTFA
ncbi:MAG TPA: flagellar hook-length control protein FliK [Thiobacillus sp.]|nr:flagellar hook-length control protein FliK [Thiobacillus sp.]HQT69835.1 flagellar hook-length control protein FliK [Thiobacillus sp.]